MTQEDKELLLKDLCGRLPYGVKCKYHDCCEGDYGEGTICGFERQEYIQIDGACIHIEEVKPYLFPLSNMTEEQEDEWYRLHVQPLFDRLSAKDKKEDLMLQAKSLCIGIDYLIANHFDYRGLIPMGLAKDATGLNIY